MTFASWLGRRALGPFSKALPSIGDTDDDAIDRAGDLPPEVWAYLRENRFFGMIIPAEYGGLGFGHHAHATVVARIATVNIAAAVTVMVPNSLGPAELLLRYGTTAQKDHYLPRLADGRELPCFALTSPYAGSDAASIPDRGVLVEREFEGRPTRGFLVTFNKRYITLAPVATVVGLAFHAWDDAQAEGRRDLGITCALIPVPHPGVNIGRRHHPLDSAFMNGPISGHEVFVPLDWVIGGAERVGQGWRMLMESLAAGRAVSLPALGSSLQQASLYVANGYGIVRDQFGVPIGRFHAVAALIAKMAVELYATDAARRYTAAALDRGESPSVASAILKVQLTEAGRRAVNDAMDILGGKGIMQGPSNLLGVAYRHAPIAITVEGANILTRALIIFGQGAVRCHPYVLAEMNAVGQRDAGALGRALLGHARHVARNLWCSVLAAPLIGTPPAALSKEARLIAQLSAKYALTADLAMGLLGGKLKRMELLSARLGDVLSHLYLAAAAVWRYAQDDDPAMLPFARAAIRLQLDHAAAVLRDLYANLPSPARRILGAIILRGTGHLAPLRDRQLLDYAERLRTDRQVIARLCPDVSVPKAGGLLDLMRALELAAELGDEVPELNAFVRRTDSLEEAAGQVAGKRAAARELAYLLAADRVIQIDDFPR